MMSAKGADLGHSEAVRALWGEKDEEASEKLYTLVQHVEVASVNGLQT